MFTPLLLFIHRPPKLTFFAEHFENRISLCFTLYAAVVLSVPVMPALQFLDLFSSCYHGPLVELLNL